MNTLKMILMANSRKAGEKCVAGIELDTGNWVRPVKPGGGALSTQDICYPNGSIPALLDLIRVPVEAREPLYYQPENWVIDPDIYWDRLGIFSKGKLLPYCARTPYIFYDRNDCIHSSSCRRLDVTHSLLLVKPQGVVFRKGIKTTGQPQLRALFSHNGYGYDLVVTDPDWESRYGDAENGDYPYGQNCLFTLSLGEAFEEYHYKLVAGVIEL